MFLAGRTGVSCGTTGTGTLTLGVALGATAVNLASFQSFASAGVTNGAEVPYLILDSNGNWEYGYGTYTSSGTTLTRNVVASNNSNSAINLSGSEQVFLLPLPSTNGDVLGGFPNCLRGFDVAQNLQINASVGSNLLTVSVTDNAGNAPSITSPIYIPFRDPTAANGDPIWRRVTSALSISTNAVGASLGSLSNTAFRFWVCAFDNAGTVVLALINCFNGTTTIFPLNEGTVQSTTAMSASATAAGTFYTPNGTTLSNKSFRILGYVEYNSTGLAIAGTYASGPNFIQLFGPGIARPGQSVQLLTNSTTTAVSFNQTSIGVLSGGLTQAITPTSAANPIKVFGTGTLGFSASGYSAQVQLSRGSTGIGESNGAAGTGSNAGTCITLRTLDLPNTISSTTYQFQTRNNASNTTYWPLGNTGGVYSPSAGVYLEVEEIMG